MYRLFDCWLIIKYSPRTLSKIYYFNYSPSWIQILLNINVWESGTKIRKSLNSVETKEENLRYELDKKKTLNLKEKN